MKKISLPILVLIGAVILVSALWFYDSYRMNSYVSEPKLGDIYILHEDNIYAPIKVDKIEGEQIWMINYVYYFEDAVPDREQINDSEFDESAYLIYEHTELKKMYDQNRIVEIYRE